jgi:hypothetical protein
MLTPLDDLPFHQIASTFDHVGSSDPRFFDRYWFVAYDPQGRFSLATGLGVYKNMNVLDGFVCVVVGGKQYNVRVSRAYRPDFSIGAGPLRYEVIEGLKTFRLVLEPNEFGIAMDLTWNASFPAFEEAYHRQRVGGMLQQDYLRYYQWGTVTGTLSVGGQTFDCGPGGVFGFRDRSFGVRPGVGGRMPIPAPAHDAKSRAAPGLSLGIAFGTKEESSTFVVSEDDQGALIGFDGRIGYTAESGKPVLELESCTHEVSLLPGTLSFAGAKIVLRDKLGADHVLEVERLTNPLVYAGFGYNDGYVDKLGLGVYRGLNYIEGETYDVSDPEKVIDESGRRDFGQTLPFCAFPLRVTFDGRAGFADSIAMIMPNHKRYAISAAKKA